MTEDRVLADRPSRGVHTCHDGCPCHTGGHPAPDFEEAAPCEFANGRCVTCGTVGYDPGDLEQITRDIAVLSRAALTPAQEVNRMDVPERDELLRVLANLRQVAINGGAMKEGGGYDRVVLQPLLSDTPPTRGVVDPCEVDRLRDLLRIVRAHLDDREISSAEAIKRALAAIDAPRAQGVVSGRVIERVECSGCGQEWHAMDCGGCGQEVTVRYARVLDEERQDA